MAYLTPVNGDAQPVFALDVQNGPIAASTSTSGATATVQPAGPKLDFVRFVANNSMATQSGVQEYVANVIQALQQTCTVAMYQVDTTALSIAYYPTGAFANAATALAAANITFTGYQLDSATANGFKLSA
jgi:hypothetical protein